jgi:DegV family protein with EDD domain
MHSVAILTDSTVQFPSHSFAGRELVHIIPLSIELRGKLYDGGKNLKPGDLLNTATPTLTPRLVSPTPDQFSEFFTADETGKPYDQILAIFSSSQLTTVVENAIKGHHQISGKVTIKIVDSATISIGLGALVQAAAEAFARGALLADVDRLVRAMIPHIYTVFCTPSLSYLGYSGFVDHAQATVGELLGLFPLFSIEEGHLSPLEKVRNHRQVLDFFQEFLEEFDQLQQITFLQSSSSSAITQDGRILRDHAQDAFPKTPFSEHNINLSLAVMLGPTALGLCVIEGPGGKTRA